MDNEDIQEKILEIVNNNEINTVDELVELIIADTGFTRKDALDKVLELENKGRLRLTSPPDDIPVMINEYLLSKHAVWFWIMMVLSIGAIISVFVINEENTPLIFIRYVLGVLFILFLPGYSLVKALFPPREIDYLERTVLSMGISISLVPVVGMILNYTPWGIRLIPVTLFLLILTTTFTVIALIREFSLVRNQKETYET